MELTKEQEIWLLEVWESEHQEWMRRMEENDDIGIADR